jgi:hypothetical protein
MRRLSYSDAIWETHGHDVALFENCATWHIAQCPHDMDAVVLIHSSASYALPAPAAFSQIGPSGSVA